MTRLGMFTKTIYPDGYDTSKIRECCVVIPDDKADDESYINSKSMEASLQCVTCLGCPAAKDW